MSYFTFHIAEGTEVIRLISHVKLHLFGRGLEGEKYTKGFVQKYCIILPSPGGN